jgi:hypothetical protein
MTRWHAILASILLASVARAGEPTGLPFIGGFTDSSSVPLFLPEGKLTFVTKYGKLTVPISEIVLTATEELGSPDYQKREQAQKQLLSWGEVALPTLKKTMSGTNAEATRRAEEIVTKMQANLPRDRQEVHDFDLIVTETSSFRGTLEADTIQASTKFFGETKLKLADLRTLRNVILDPAPKPAVATAPVRPGGRPGNFNAQPVFPLPLMPNAPPGVGR